MPKSVLNQLVSENILYVPRKTLDRSKTITDVRYFNFQEKKQKTTRVEQETIEYLFFLWVFLSPYTLMAFVKV